MQHGLVSFSASRALEKYILRSNETRHGMALGEAVDLPICRSSE